MAYESPHNDRSNCGCALNSAMMALVVLVERVGECNKSYFGTEFRRASKHHHPAVVDSDIP
jgi:hypothetical protein